MKPDVHVGRFAEAAVGRKLNDQDVIELMTRSAARIGIKALELDWRIWEASRGGDSRTRARRREAGCGQDGRCGCSTSTSRSASAGTSTTRRTIWRSSLDAIVTSMGRGTVALVAVGTPPRVSDVQPDCAVRLQ